MKADNTTNIQEYAETSLDVANPEKYQQYKHTLYKVTTHTDAQNRGAAQ
jgi:hypothetical protein